MAIGAVDSEVEEVKLNHGSVICLDDDKNKEVIIPYINLNTNKAVGKSIREEAHATIDTLFDYCDV